ncbi:class I SAM-dependent methyltransferase [Myxococcota bacterium]|nr:class I SAM-dependent methyltransferase [Myxococcota bacterium]
MSTPQSGVDLEDYADYWEQLNASHSHHPGNRYRYWLVAHRLSKVAARFDSVLDCGCGDGSLLAVIREKFQPVRCYGFDVNSTNVDMLRSRVPDGEFHCVDLGDPAARLPIPPVDLALCSEVIEHVPNDDVALENLARFVAPGGLLVLTTQAGPIRRTEQFLGHLRHYDLEDLRARIQSVGFEIVESSRSGWPLLDAQKRVAARFFQQVQDHVIKPQRPSFWVRSVFAALFHAYKLCAFGRGPQLFVLARRLPTRVSASKGRGMEREP